MTFAFVLLAASLVSQADAVSPAESTGDVPPPPPMTSETPPPAPEATPPAAAAPAQASPAAGTVVASPDAPTRKKESFTRFGAMLDAGLPDGFGLSALYRPFKPLRLQFGAVTTTSAFGLRGGLAYIPFHFVVSPSFTFELGHMFEGSTQFLRNFGAGAALSATDRIFERFSYTFVNGHIGLEMGSPDSFSFYIKGGLSYVDLRLSDFEEKFRVATGDPSFSSAPAHVHYSGPSAKLGFVFYFF
jgi:hypothetical protein